MQESAAGGQANRQARPVEGGGLDALQVLEALADPVIIADSGGTIRYANLACEDLLGWRDGALVGQTVEVLQPERHREQAVEGFRSFADQHNARMQGPPVRMVVLTEDGDEIAVEISASVRDARGGSPLVIVTLRDMRDRIELERERSLSRYLRATADAAARITSRLDMDYVLQTVASTLVEDLDVILAQVWLLAPETNSLYLRMQAGADGESVDRHEIHWAALPTWLNEAMHGVEPILFRDLRDDSRITNEWMRAHGVTWIVGVPLQIAETPRGIMVCAFGGQVWSEVVAVLQSFAAIVSTSLNDVQHLVAEQEARAEAERAEQDFSFLAEASRALAASLDYETTLKTAAHLAVPHLADWCVVDVVEDGSNIRRLEVAHEREEKTHLAHAIARYTPSLDDETDVARVVRSGQPLLVSEPSAAHLDIVAAGPSHRQVVQQMGVESYMCVPMIARGEVHGVLSLVSSDPAQRYSLADLALAEDFARRAAAGVDNAALHTELQAAVRLRDEFLSTVSHDLKNPIAAVKGRAQMLRRRADRLPDAERARFADGLDAIDTSTDRMVRLISDLVDVARLRSGSPLELRRVLVDIVTVVRRAAEEQQAATRQHRIAVHAANEPIVGRWDADRLERVVDNLVSNAVKYSLYGGEVDIDIAVEGNGVVVRISDRGVGIPKDELPRVFDRFFRASNVGSSIPGSGIGLAGAMQIVQQHDGTIAVERREGGGSTFSVWLPLDDPKGRMWGDSGDGAPALHRPSD